MVKATPHVNGASEVTQDLEAEVKALTGRTLSGIPVISNRKLATQIRLRNGNGSESQVCAPKTTCGRSRGFQSRLWVNTFTVAAPIKILIMIRTNLLSLPPDEFVTAPAPLGAETRPRSPL